MINVETALALFDDDDQIKQEFGVDNDLWENEIGPNLVLLEGQGLAILQYANEVDHPVSAYLTSAGIKRKSMLSKGQNHSKRLTPEDQDIILNHLVENYPLGSVAFLAIHEPIHGFSGDALYAILHHFGDLDLIDYEGCRTIDRMTIELVVKVKAHEFIQQGGFHGKYELFQKTVEKLLWEVEKLEATDKSDNNKFTTFKKNIQDYVSVIANISTAVDSGTKMFDS